MRQPKFRIRVIADVGCDVNGGIPATIRSTTINEPVFGYDEYGGEIAPYIPESIDIMAIDNLPNEFAAQCRWRIRPVIDRPCLGGINLNPDHVWSTMPLSLRMEN